MILPFVLLTFLGVLIATGFDRSPQGDFALQETGSVTTSQEEDFVATAHAALAFAEANQGFTGAISSAQLQPYMGNYAYPSQWAAAEQGGQLYVWSNALPNKALSGIASATQTDCAYASVSQGQMTSECANLFLGAAPAGVPDGAVIYVIETPTS
ncbi:type IV pilus biogenesis protein PilM [Acidithiobacillus sp. IBUN Pt1247-S3]|uniref:type IV pilus biogenesis protein PilM n=1 Tax=Acidithiobacillus sp. IBUN Pt1247-S3 TaxID=3166642 RepID=UPI0034E529FA